MTEAPKLTKKYLKTIMKQRLANRTFNRVQFITEFSLSDRRARRYLNEIAEELKEVKSPELEILRSYCLENLTEKAKQRNLSEKALVTLVLAGEAAKTEITGNLNVTGFNEGIAKLIEISRDDSNESKG